MRDSDKRPATAVAGGESDQSVTLVAGQSVCVGRVREKDAEPAAGELMGGTGLARATLRFTHPSASPQFARRLQEPPKTLDLLDIVAGGNGLGTRREYGIDPTTGAIDAYFVARWRDGNGEYRKVSRHPMIDGVFVPNGKRSPVRIDSAGHEFDGFPPTSDIAWGSIWTRDAATKPGAGTTREHCWMHALGAADQYMPDRRGLLGLHPNSGISFDLGGIRRIYPDARPARFRAVAGMGDTSSRSTKVDRLADVWVFVDGQLKFHRRGLCPEAGPVIVDVELGPNDRYLTLATTDGAGEAGKYAGNWRAAAGDWVFYGDPTLQMSLIETAGRPLENRKEAALHSEQ